MIKRNNTYCAVGFHTRFNALFLELYLLFSRKKVYFYDTLLFSKGSINKWFVKTGKASFKNNGVGQIKGLDYAVNIDALELVESFFDRYVSNLSFRKRVERSLATNKYDCYLKKKLSYDIYEALCGLYLVKEFSQDKDIIMVDSLTNRFAVNEFLKKHKVDFRILWLNFNILLWLEPVAYYIYLAKKILRAGIGYRDKQRIKLYREAVWGLYRPVLRDDFLVDGAHFKKDDILFHSRYKEASRDKAASQLKDAGYKVIDFNRCKLNLKKDLRAFVDIFLYQPIWVFFKLSFGRKEYLVEHALKFYIDCIQHFLFLTNYEAKCHVSSSDCAEVAETAIMNRLGCKNILYHWSDMTLFKNVLHAFTAHNVYYVWGPIHYEFKKEYYCFDKVKIVGSFLLRLYFDSLREEKRSGGLKKRILLCDCSVHNGGPHAEGFYLEFLDLALDMMNAIDDAEFIFKPKKSFETAVSDYFSNEENRKIYKERLERLRKNTRFIYHDYSSQIEPLIAISDIVVTMSTTSPSTIALIVGKEAVYYDTTGNNAHPLTRYMNKVVFDDKKSLIDNVKDILDHKKSVFDYIDKNLLNDYEPFRDSKALERLIAAVYKETQSPLYETLSKDRC